MQFYCVHGYTKKKHNQTLVPFRGGNFFISSGTVRSMPGINCKMVSLHVLAYYQIGECFTLRNDIGIMHFTSATSRQSIRCSIDLHVDESHFDKQYK